MGTEERKDYASGEGVLERIIVHEKDIVSRVAEMAKDVTASFSGGEVTIVPVLTGSLIFTADLMRYMDLRVRVEPVSVNSYPGTSTRSQGCRFRLPPPDTIAGHDILIVDDIYDSGETMKFIIDELRSVGVNRIEVCVLLRKSRPDLPDRNDLTNYVGFDIPDEFVVGYGLDYDGLYRNIPSIGVLSGDLIGGEGEDG